MRDRDRELKLRSELIGLMGRLNSEWDSVRDRGIPTSDVTFCSYWKIGTAPPI